MREFTLDLCMWPYIYTGKQDTKLVNGKELCALAKKFGLGVELLDAETIPYARQLGIPVLTHLPNLSNGKPAYRHGLCDPDDQIVRMVQQAYMEAIELAAPGEKVLIFTGVVTPERRRASIWADFSRNLAPVHEVAKKKGVILLLEHLNKHGDNPDDMKGHADYVGCDLLEVAELVSKWESEHLRLLYDVYHVALMHPQEWLPLLRKYLPIIGHIHVAGIKDGKPSRCSLKRDNTIHYPFFFQQLNALGYNMGVGLEYLLGDDEEPFWTVKDAVELAQSA